MSAASSAIPDDGSTAPHWLELLVEHDYALWRLEQILEQVKRRSPLDAMIDQATGHLDAEAAELMATVDECRRELGLPPIITAGSDTDGVG